MTPSTTLPRRHLLAASAAALSAAGLASWTGAAQAQPSQRQHPSRCRATQAGRLATR